VLNIVLLGLFQYLKKKMSPKFGQEIDEYIPKILHNFLKNIIFRGFSEIFKCGDLLIPIQLGRLKNH